jgi:hypothetical protein
VADCCECIEPSGSGATNLVNYATIFLTSKLHIPIESSVYNSGWDASDKV